MATSTSKTATPVAGKGKGGTSATANGKGKGKGKAPAAPKLTPREQVAQHRATAHGVQRRWDDASEDARLALQPELDAAYTVATLAMIDLPSDQLSAEDREYMAEHGANAIRAQSTAQARTVTVQGQADEVRKALATARSDEAQRTTNVALVLHGLIAVHGVLSQKQASERYGLTKQQVSHYVLTGQVARRLHTSSPTRVVYIHQAGGNQRTALKDAATAPGATFDSVRASLGDKPADTPARQAREAARAEAASESESVPENVSKQAVKLTNALLVLAQGGDTAADLAESSGVDIMRALVSAVDAYVRRTNLPLSKAQRKLHAVPDDEVVTA